jgi:hypothetical protein
MFFFSQASVLLSVESMLIRGPRGTTIDQSKGNPVDEPRFSGFNRRTGCSQVFA